jgi:hypothetical protein
MRNAQSMILAQILVSIRNLIDTAIAMLQGEFDEEAAAAAPGIRPDSNGVLGKAEPAFPATFGGSAEQSPRSSTPPQNNSGD